jgi:hypothetical protein
VQFTLYSEKSVAQCLTAINARLQVKGSASRAELDGWIDKSGDFSLTITSRVAVYFKRHTTLRAKVERKSGFTQITGSVPDGVPREGRILVFAALGVVSAMLLSSGSPLLALIVLPVGLALYVAMKGDHDNSAVLMNELQKTLKAKPTPPKKTENAGKPSARRSRSATRLTKD